MTNLTAPPAWANPGPVEGTPTPSGKDSPLTTIPTRFYRDPQFKGADLRVIGHICRRDAIYRSGLNFESLEEIARGSGVSVRKVQQTITKLTRADLMDVRPGLYKGSPVAVRALRFLPAYPPDAAHAHASRPVRDLAPAHGGSPDAAHGGAPVKGSEKGERERGG